MIFETDHKVMGSDFEVFNDMVAAPPAGTHSFHKNTD
jgi:hypothetical protein